MNNTDMVILPSPSLERGQRLVWHSHHDKARRALTKGKDATWTCSGDTWPHQGGWEGLLGEDLEACPLEGQHMARSSPLEPTFCSVLSAKIALIMAERGSACAVSNLRRQEPPGLYGVTSFLNTVWMWTDRHTDHWAAISIIYHRVIWLIYISLLSFSRPLAFPTLEHRW